MKPLFDQNLSHKLCVMLADVYPASEQVRRAALDRAADGGRAALIEGFLQDSDAACLELY